MLLQNLFRASLVTGFTIAVFACSSPDKEGSKSKSPVQVACEHMNEVCSGTQGYRKQDCSDTDAQYAALNPTDQAEADALVPCILAANSCQPAVQCLQPASSKQGSGSSGSSDDKTHTTEDACEHINDLCADTDGFKTQDCSNSQADYEKLSDNDKKLADSIVPCVMDAEACSDAFDCLDLKK